MPRFLSKLISLVTTFCYVFMILLAPAGNAVASFGENAWATWQASKGHWIPNQVNPLLNVPFPRGNWSVIASAKAKGGVISDLRMIQGQRWITNNNQGAGQAGQPSNMIGDTIYKLPGPSRIVYALYSPDTAMARIYVERIEKTLLGTVDVALSDFTPHHGEQWRAQMKYLTKDEAYMRPLSYLAGYNPFEAFRGAPEDPRFHNCSWACVQVAVGHAMRNQRAVIGWIGVSTSRLAVRQVSDDGLIQKKVTTYIDGYAKPQWYLATPMEAQPRGQTAQICVGPNTTADGGCNDPAHVAKSGVSVALFTGGNMPEGEDHIYHREQTDSGFTVLAFAIFTAAIAFATAGAGALESFGVEGFGGLGATGVTAGGAIDATTFAGIAGAGYSTATALTQGGGLTSAQSGYLGQTGSGAITPATPANQDAAAVANIVQQHHINTPIGSPDALSGVNRQYAGDCPDQWTAAECEAHNYDPGTIHRTDRYMQHNTVLWMRQRYADCEAAGYTGPNLHRCTAPMPNGLYMDLTEELRQQQ